MTVTLPEAPSALLTSSANRFIWYDLMSTDREKALAFYQDLLGWSVQTIDMGEMGEYHMMHASGAPFGGAVQMDEALGLPSHWISYVACEDVDAVAARVTELGGSIGHGPMDIPNVGRFAVASDPQGAAFSPMSALPTAPTAPESTMDGVVPPGCPIWAELATTDPEAATAFYAAVFGWDVQATPMQHGGTYWLLGRGPDQPQAGGIFQKPEIVPVATWIVYFHVRDAELTAAKAQELGGSALSRVIPVPGIGNVCWLQDLSGAVFAVMQPTW